MKISICFSIVPGYRLYMIFGRKKLVAKKLRKIDFFFKFKILNWKFWHFKKNHFSVLELTTPIKKIHLDILKKVFYWPPTPKLYVVAQLHGVPHGMLQVFTIILYQNVFQNPEHFRTQVSLSPEQSTLDEHALPYKNGVLKLMIFFIVCEILGHI
jgi:hypothetical protein